MKVIFNCSAYAFHKDHYDKIDKELRRRGHTTIFSYSIEDYFEDADYTITADESQTSLGGKSIWIGHSFDAKGAMWGDQRCLSNLNKNTDYMFVYSSEYKSILKQHTRKPIYVVGMSMLDGLYGRHGNKILFAPTFDEELNGEVIAGECVEKRSNVIVRRHPAHYKNQRELAEMMSVSGVVISDYSSVGMESIVLDKPTILVNNPNRFNYKSFPKDDYICNMARKATIEVSRDDELLDAIKMYTENPAYLRKERRYWGNKLCEYRGVSTERTVDLIEDLYAQK